MSRRNFVFRTAGEISPETSVPEIKRVLLESSEPSSHVSAVVVLPVTYSILERWSLFQGFAVENPSATVRASSLRAFEAFVRACEIEVRG